ncbi:MULTISPECIES: hypothetical protein [unclassified Eubacterium (in: firmicutes)]|uniref:hypothetical protein n=1 Tax=unclassified Eubacterium (in: firmicutes) TaxID=2624479 RepID=UPI0013143E1B|nr:MULTISPECIES: hypothetical protein [unclassified Eubacterium (in: firmicutes)]
MIITEKTTINGKKFKHTYSDKGMKIKRDNVMYDEAYDPVGFDREYEETNIPIESEVEE